MAKSKSVYEVLYVVPVAGFPNRRTVVVKRNGTEVRPYSLIITYINRTDISSRATCDTAFSHNKLNQDGSTTVENTATYGTFLASSDYDGDVRITSVKNDSYLTVNDSAKFKITF